ncbi:uncharacterized protein H6S33_004585 [Morchella sextelata]|uniref:uncharacterized protein n=1 Tax=Morchella sextelata TaxID=1174677 RepID=UPI001D035E80|nr:uncharacterized protein H6S33_004585 [Morchella sextelata]KAH0605363.1 hypothetical protein H6S33_004585 [Morchella sextelata]
MSRNARPSQWRRATVPDLFPPRVPVGTLPLAVPFERVAISFRSASQQLAPTEDVKHHNSFYSCWLPIRMSNRVGAHLSPANRNRLPVINGVGGCWVDSPTYLGLSQEDSLMPEL